MDRGLPHSAVHSKAEPTVDPAAACASRGKQSRGDVHSDSAEWILALDAGVGAGAAAGVSTASASLPPDTAVEASGVPSEQPQAKRRRDAATPPAGLRELSTRANPPDCNGDSDGLDDADADGETYVGDSDSDSDSDSDGDGDGDGDGDHSNTESESARQEYQARIIRDAAMSGVSARIREALLDSTHSTEAVKAAARAWLVVQDELDTLLAETVREGEDTGRVEHWARCGAQPGQRVRDALHQLAHMCQDQLVLVLVRWYPELRSGAFAAAVRHTCRHLAEQLLQPLTGTVRKNMAAEVAATERGLPRLLKEQGVASDNVDARHSLMVQLCAGGDQDAVRNLMNHYVHSGVTTCFYWGRSPLQAAAEAGHSGVVEMVLAGSPTICVRRAAVLATVNGHTKCAEALLWRVAPPDRIRTGLLDIAVQCDHVEVLEVVLTGSRFDQDVLKRALLKAAKHDRLACVRALLGALPPAARAAGREEALSRASAEGCGHVVEGLLLDGGPASGRPLQLAAAGGHVHTVRILLQGGTPVHGSSENVPDNGTPLRHAARGDHAHVVEVLDHEAAVRYDTEEDVLVQAAVSGSAPTVKLLLGAKAENRPRALARAAE